MKLFWTVLGLAVVAGAAYAGNLDTFVAPAEVVPADEPMGGSNAAWIVPLLAIALIAVAASGNDDGGS